MFTYIVRVLNKKRDELMEFLKGKDIITGVHYIPNHFQTICKEFRAENLKNTEILADEILTLPLYFSLTDNELETVFEALREFFK